MSRMEDLVNILNKYAYEYYVLDEPTVSDIEYDKLYDELLKLEKESGTVLFNSPTKRVGGEPIDKFEKHEHIKRLYSLDKALTKEAVIAFISRIEKLHPKKDLDYTVEYKFDGLTICITYDNGKFLRATTRGNGVVGEDVTAQVLTIKSFPMEIDYKGTIEVQGEAVIRLSVLKEINKKLQTPLKNARNAVAGAIRNLDPKITAERRPDIYFYNVNYMSDGKINTQTECVDFLKKNGFKVYPFLEVCHNSEQIMSAIKNVEKTRKTLDVLTDGAVIKLNDFNIREELGSTDKFPRWALAFKFEAEEVSTILQDVVWQVGRSGKLTPIGILEPVELAGASVQKATLNNYDDVCRKGVKIGSRVLVRRSNEVIPEILGTTEYHITDTPVLKPQKCPYCQSELVENGANIFCPNKNCKPRLIGKFSSFASKDGFDIQGFSEMTASVLIDKFKVYYFSDLFKIDSEEVLKLDGFKDAKTNNLFQALENAKKVDFSNFIFALGIENVGKKTAKDLSKRFDSLNALMDASIESLSFIDDIGDVVSKSIYDYFRCEENVYDINELLKLGVIINYPKKSVDGAFLGEKVVLTGTLPTYKRDEAAKLIEDNGGEIMSSVSKNTTLVLAGESAGSKLDKAIKLGIKIIDEDEFKRRLGI